jgi:REP element-mobilizing transposase RayT
MYYHIVAKCCHNKFVLIGNSNAESHYEAAIPSAQEQPYDTI